MNRNFYIPLILILIVAVFMAISGDYPLSSCILLVLGAFAVLGVGKKTEYNFTYMWLAGLISLMICMILSIGLAKLAIDIPWIRTVWLWPTQ